MAKAVFRPNEVTLVDQRVVLELPQNYSEASRPQIEEMEMPDMGAVEEYQGPTADDLRREAEAFKLQWDAERDAMIRSAKAEAENIVRDAEERAKEKGERTAGEAEKLKRDAEAEAERISAEAARKAEDLALSSQNAFEEERKKVLEEGRAAGREEGYQAGMEEVTRLIERTRIVLERAQGKRADILEETEQQLVDLVILMTRKVVKAISENQRSVVISNVAEALKKVKGRGTIIIRVNLSDLKLTTEHINNYISKVEGAKNIQVMEDSTVDQGGCIVETDFGEIDARISSQLAELESKILEMSPIKGRAKSAPGTEGA